MINLEIDQHIAVVTLNKPDSLNSLSTSMVDELIDTFEKFNDDDTVRAIILTSVGRAFSVGLDLKELSTDVGFSKHVLGVDSPLIKTIAECRKPIIGAINGFAVTGGFELALACDFLYAAQSAKFADTHARVGLVPGWGLSQKLPRLVGINRAREISFTGNYFTAQNAMDWGLVNKVIPDEALLDEAIKCATQIASCEQNALYEIKTMMNTGWEIPLRDALQMEGDTANDYNGKVDTSVMQQRLDALRTRANKN